MYPTAATSLARSCPDLERQVRSAPEDLFESAPSFAHGSLNSGHYRVSTKTLCSPALSFASSASFSECAIHFAIFAAYVIVFPSGALIDHLFLTAAYLSVAVADIQIERL